MSTRHPQTSMEAQKAGAGMIVNGTTIDKHGDNLLIQTPFGSEDETFWHVVTNQKNFVSMNDFTAGEGSFVTKMRSLQELGVRVQESTKSRSTVFQVPLTLLFEVEQRLDNVEAIRDLAYNLPDERFREKQATRRRHTSIKNLTLQDYPTKETEEKRAELLPLLNQRPNNVHFFLNLDYYKTLDQEYILGWKPLLHKATTNEFSTVEPKIGGASMAQNIIASMKKALAGEIPEEVFEEDAVTESPRWVSEMMGRKGFHYGPEQDFVEKYQSYLIQHRDGKAFLEEIRDGVPVWNDRAQKGMRFINLPPSSFVSAQEYNRYLWGEKQSAEETAQQVGGRLILTGKALLK